jgi:phosphopantothenoylcysteine decarboxylase/phosphopantothenate--cysteine ligase
MLKGKTVILGVTGGIAAYKIASLASSLVKLHCNVQVIMTKNAANFINPITFETLTGNKCLMDTFDRNFQYSVEHVALAKLADLLLVAPASADSIGKMAGGIADDMLTTTVLACTCKKLVSPSMNTNMYRNPIVQDNLEKLRRFGFEIIEPATGFLACRDVGEGKLPEPDTLLQYILRELAFEKDLAGKKVLVTAGPTREYLDPVRYLSNPSSGKMGYAVARNCMLRGAQVTLISGPVSIDPPPFVELVPVTSAQEMFVAVRERAPQQDIIVKSAAVADYRPKYVAQEKVKKTEGDLSIPMERTEDILRYLGEHKKPGQFLCGFSMETQNMVENSRAKLARKNLDLIVANNVKEAGAGFAGNTNRITLITREDVLPLDLMSKEEAAGRIMDYILSRLPS